MQVTKTFIISQSNIILSVRGTLGLWNCLIYFRPRVIKYLRSSEEEKRKQRRIRALQNALKQCKGKQQQQQQRQSQLSQPDRHHHPDSTLHQADLEKEEGTRRTDSTENSSSASILISSSTMGNNDKVISKNVVTSTKEGWELYVEDSEIDYKDFQITANEENQEEKLPDV